MYIICTICCIVYFMATAYCLSTSRVWCDDATAKMADSLCGGVSDEKDPENHDHKGLKCPWAAAAISRKTDVSGSAAKMTETLGCYEKTTVKDEQHEHSGELEHLTTDLRLRFQRGFKFTNTSLFNVATSELYKMLFWLIF